MPYAICDNCSQELEESDLLEQEGCWWDDLQPGEEVPAGQCCNCGGLCYLIENPHRREKKEAAGQ